MPEADVLMGLLRDGLEAAVDEDVRAVTACLHRVADVDDREGGRGDVFFAVACGWAATIPRALQFERGVAATIIDLPGASAADRDEASAVAGFIASVGNEDTSGALMLWQQLEDDEALAVVAGVLRVAAQSIRYAARREAGE